MRVLVFSMLFAVTPAPTTADAPVQPDTMTFTREQIHQMEDEFNAILNRREAEAFQRGRADARERCASLI